MLSRVALESICKEADKLNTAFSDLLTPSTGKNQQIKEWKQVVFSTKGLLLLFSLILCIYINIPKSLYLHVMYSNVHCIAGNISPRAKDNWPWSRGISLPANIPSFPSYSQNFPSGATFKYPDISRNMNWNLLGEISIFSFLIFAQHPQWWEKKVSMMYVIVRHTKTS